MRKYDLICEEIKKYGTAAVCISGGTDSTLVAKAAVDSLGPEKVVGITLYSAFLTGAEMEECEALCKYLGIRHIVAQANLFDDPHIIRNDKDRCYYCKIRMASVVRRVAFENGYKFLFDGSTDSSNADDTYGGKALEECEIISPLKLVHMGKEEIFSELKRMGMERYIYPENACLATRIAFGESITLKNLRRIRAAENFLRRLGFEIVRVRVSGSDVRIEVEKEKIEDLNEQMEEVTEEIKGLGFKTVTVDPNGYVTRGCEPLGKRLEAE